MYDLNCKQSSKVPLFFTLCFGANCTHALLALHVMKFARPPAHSTPPEHLSDSLESKREAAHMRTGHPSSSIACCSSNRRAIWSRRCRQIEFLLFAAVKNLYPLEPGNCTVDVFDVHRSTAGQASTRNLKIIARSGHQLY